MPVMARAYSAAEIAAEAACAEDRVAWATGIGLITPDGNGRFTYGDVLTIKMVSALLDGGVPAASMERAAADGSLSFQRTDEYLPYEPGPRSDRTFDDFLKRAGPGAELLPAIYEVLGLPKPDPSAPIHVDEEAVRTLPRCVGDVAGRRRADPCRQADVAGCLRGDARLDGSHG
jgi:hypothetical protein